MSLPVNCKFRGPPGFQSLYVSPQCYEQAFVVFGTTNNHAFGKCPVSFDNQYAYTSDNPRIGELSVPIMELSTPNPQCGNCLRTLRDRSDCFLFDVQRADGTLIPVAAVNNPRCRAVAKHQLSQCALQCGTCVPA